MFTSAWLTCYKTFSLTRWYMLHDETLKNWCLVCAWKMLWWHLACGKQRRILIFGVLGQFTLGPSGRFATTDVIQISTTRARYIHLTSCSNSWPCYYFIQNFLDIRNTNSHNEANEKASGEVIWQHSHYIFIELPVQLHGLQVSRVRSE